MRALFTAGLWQTRTLPKPTLVALGWHSPGSADPRSLTVTAPEQRYVCLLDFAAAIRLRASLGVEIRDNRVEEKLLA